MKRILIVDDSPLEIKIIRKFLGDEYDILEAHDGESALDMAKTALPDLVLMDIIMPGMDGLTACKILKSQAATADIPVVFITAASDTQDIVKGFDAGGQDYITKPFHSHELCARIKVHMDLKKSKETLLKYAQEMEMKNKELSGLMLKLENSAMTDFLTGLANRRQMMQRVKAELSALKRNDGIATLIMADIDDFKKINDTYGHDCGDTVLKRAADLLKSVIREEDMVARWGGEEFLLLLPGIDIENAQAAAERMRAMFEAARFECGDKIFSATVTLGLAKLNENTGVEDSIKKADEALYKGKKLSKNCVVV